MLARLGHVLGWTGNLLALLTLVGTAVFLYAANDPGRLPRGDFWFFGISGCIIALVLFGIGRALRYIFAGSTRLGKASATQPDRLSKSSACCHEADQVRHAPRPPCIHVGIIRDG